MAHVGQQVIEGRRIAGHFQPDIEALAHAQAALDLREGLSLDVDGAGRTQPDGQFEPAVDQVGNHHVAGTRVATDRRRHRADRAGAGDQNILPQQVELKGRMHRVAEGVEERRNIQVDALAVLPDVGHGQGQVFGKGAGTVHPDAAGMGTEMATASHAVAAAAADHMALAGHNLPGAEVHHIGADLDDLADKLVADNHGHRDGFPGPAVPVVNVHVSATDGGPQHADQHIVDADARNRHLLQPETGRGLLLDQCQHDASLVQGQRFTRVARPDFLGGAEALALSAPGRASRCVRQTA